MLFDRVGGRRVVVLASGDPLLAGIGSTLVDLLGTDAVRIHPAVSSATGISMWYAVICSPVAA